MRCQSCGNDNLDDAQFCEHCAAELGALCLACQTRNQAGARFCRQCRAPLRASEQASAGRTPTPAPSPVVPAVLAGGRYQVQRFLGEGGKKRVYLAHDSRLDTDVAVALIKTDGLDADGLTRIRREAQAMSRLRDEPHIVTVLDIGDEHGQPYIIQEYMAGGSLEDLLREAAGHRLDIDLALRIAGQVCQALSHAHERGIIHRDLKPGNIWLSSDGLAKLGDFGLAIALDRSRLTREGMMVGTASYMPPEQALGGDVTPRSDLYALGCVIYEMVTGRPPFLGDDTVAVISQHINTAPIAPSWHNPEVPRSLETLILRLLSKVPDDRPESAAVVAEELRRIQEPSFQETPAPGPAATEWLGFALGIFVGRREEMGQLKTVLENALSGRGSLVMLVGEPGIGKTRLAEEFGVYATLRGAQVLSGRCYEGEVALPYRPFVEAFRQYARNRSDPELRHELGEGAPEVAKIVSEIRQRFPDIPEAPALDPEAERLRLFESVSAFVRNAAGANPLVLFLDDIHWADKPSLLLLRYLARGVAGQRLLIVGAYRDVELDRTHPLSEIIATLRREQPYQRVVLRGLPAEDVLGFLTALEPSEEVAPGREQLAAALYHETEGNPFFIVEILSHLVEEGKLFRESGVWTTGGANISDLGIPEGVREVIGRRLSRLSEGCNRTLTLASTMTGGFTWEELRAITGEGEAALLDRLDEALAHQLIQERKADHAATYDFTHALIRQTLYAELSTPRRVVLHRQIGQALEELHAGNLEPHLAELAHHFYQAAPGGDIDKAIGYAKRAGDRATEVYAWEEAATHYDLALQALELKDRPDEPRCCELFLALANALWVSGDVSKSQEAFEGAWRLARQLGAPELLARAALGIGYQGDFGTVNEHLVAILEQSLDALGEADSPFRARVLARLGSALVFSPERKRKEALSRQAIDMARRLDDKPALAWVLSNSHFALWEPGNLDGRLAIADEIIRLAEEQGDGALALAGHNSYVADLLELGDIQQADREMEICAGLVEKLRRSDQVYFVDVRKAMRALLDGRFEEGERLAHQALAEARGNPAAMQLFGIQISRVRSEQGRLDELVDMIRGFADQYPAVPGWRARLASVYSELGRREDARREFERLAANGFSDIPRDGAWLVAIIYLAEACAFLGDADRAKTLCELPLPYANRNIVVGGAACNGSASRYLGALAGAAGRWEEADRHFQQALSMNVAMGAYPVAARTRLQYARMLVARDEPGDEARALELLSEALGTARELGMSRLVEEAVGLKVQLQGISSTDVKTSIDAVALAVDGERPDLRPHAAPDGTVTILFTDIEGSTELNERLGDQRWMELLRVHNAVVRDQIAAHGGFEVKSQGDGCMVAFGSARRALQCAIALQRAFAEHNRVAGEPVQVRIGLHTGEAIHEAGDFYGRHVNLASRIADQAEGGEILISSLLKELTQSAGEFEFDEGRQLSLKGLSGLQQAFQVRWQSLSPA